MVLLSKSESTFPLMRRDRSVPHNRNKVNRVIERGGNL